MQALVKYVVNFRFLYVLFAGLFFYLVSITFDLIFIPMLDMPEHWCEKWVERKIRYRSQKKCVEFTDKVQELKYRHNKKMEERYSRKMFGIFLFATFFTFLIMLLSPYSFFDQKITFENYSGAMAAAIFYGVIIGFLLPAVLQALLPSPAGWLPDEFYEIQKARTELILKEIMEMSG
jgi:hypothetical protein